MERLRQVQTLPCGTAPARPVVALPKLVVGPIPNSTYDVTMHTIRQLVDETEILGLLCRPFRHASPQVTSNIGATDLKKAEPHEPVSDAPQKLQPGVKLSHAERRQMLSSKAGKGKKSRYAMLLEVAKQRAKAA